MLSQIPLNLASEISKTLRDALEEDWIKILVPGWVLKVARVRRQTTFFAILPIAVYFKFQENFKPVAATNSLVISFWLRFYLTTMFWSHTLLVNKGAIESLFSGWLLFLCHVSHVQKPDNNTTPMFQLNSVCLFAYLEASSHCRTVPFTFYLFSAIHPSIPHPPWINHSHSSHVPAQNLST